MSPHSIRHPHPGHPARSKNIAALLALLLATLLMMLAARISHAENAAALDDISYRK